MAKEIDWLRIKNEYINTNISYRKLAEKHGISFNTLKDRAVKENWKSLKDAQHNKIATTTQQRTAEKIVAKEVNRIERITSLADKLIDKLEQATDQLDNYIVTNKQKIKTVEYDNIVKGKPKREITTETEDLAIIDGIIDRAGLKQLASALKDLKDIQTIQNDDDNSGQLDELIRGLKQDEEDL